MEGHGTRMMVEVFGGMIKQIGGNFLGPDYCQRRFPQRHLHIWIIIKEEDAFH